MSHTKIKLVDFALKSKFLYHLNFNVFQKICQRLFKQTRKDQTKVKECTKKYSQINSTNWNLKKTYKKGDKKNV